MPADIRSFFGGKPAGTKAEVPPPKDKKVGGTRKSSSRKVIEDDSDDDVVEEKKTTPKKPAQRKAKKESPKGEETTTSDYFASSNPTKPAKVAPKAEVPKHKSTAASKTKKTSKSEPDHDVVMLDDEEEGGDDIFAMDAKSTGRRKDDDYTEILSSDEEHVKPKRTTTRAKSASRSKVENVDMKVVPSNDNLLDSDDEEKRLASKRSEKAITSSKKRKSTTVSDDEDDLDEEDKLAKKATPKKKKPVAKKAKKEAESEDAEYQAILDAIPTIKAPTPPPVDLNVKFDFRAGPKNAGPPPGMGSKEVPEGQENCLMGLKFVFTGLMPTLPREEGVSLVKRYGGEVTGGPSGKTNYVVLGEDAGPSKLRKIAQLGLKTIDEDGFFLLIKTLPANGGKGVNAAKMAEKKKAEEQKIKEAAAEMDLIDKKKAQDAQKAAERAAAARGLTPPPKPAPSAAVNTELWTSKYAPTTLTQICGNKGQVAKIEKWLKNWHLNRKRKSQIRGADGTGGERAIIIHGPPGIGKTTAAHLAANLAGFDVIESNASDTRSKKLVETGLGDVLDNTSLMGFFQVNGGHEDLTKKKVVLILDEVDGMSSGDRGGVGALAKLCKKTSIPLILICNDRKLPKMKPFDFVTYDMPFRRPTTIEIRSRMATINAREKLGLSGQMIDALIEGSNKDIRQIINMLSSAKLDQIAAGLDKTDLTFDTAKQMSKAWEKHIVLKPWDLCQKLLGGGLFAPSSTATLGDKIELYFNDHDFCPLMIQENYLSTKPILANINGTSREQKLKVLELADLAAEAISDGDLVDRMIHSGQQHWTLMPTHGVFSTVRPASLMSGMMSGQTAFTKWLGNNSKQGKLVRYVKELQSHMRLRTSGDRHEIRQQYLPVLWEKLINRLQAEGKTAAPEIIELMDSYFLTRDDFDYIMELGIGPQSDENVNIETQAKATFTRLYNGQSHPMPFMKAGSVAAPMKAAKKDAPDLEEAIEEEDDDDLVVEDKPEDEEEDLEKALKNDKFVAKPKKKAPAKKAAGKKKKVEVDEEEDDSEDIKPAKKKAAPKKKATTKK